MKGTTGRFASGIDYARYGDGPRTLLWLGGGPGSEVPHGLMGRMMTKQLGPVVDAGFTVWMLTRRRGMPEGHTVADMADDYSRLIGDEFGGRVDAVLGLSYGALIALHLAARHGDRVGRVVVALGAAEISDWGRDVDRRWAEARAAGRTAEAGTVMAEYFWPHDDQQRRRRLVGPLLGIAFRGSHTSSADLLVEAAAEVAYDARDELASIQVPVLLISGEDDRFFTRAMVEETVAGIRDCTHIEYAGMGHMKAASSNRLGRDVAKFLQG